ncbi:MAG: phosphoesterase, partial [Flavobacteriaceae bacterium]|nr:phosphoesterase [Flavobacteriaceae bacterium]
DAYTTPVTASVANLDSLYGGLEVIRRTGTEEYKTLLLRDKIGNRYQMRALKKEALQFTQKLIFEEEDGSATGATDDSNVAPKGAYGFEFYTASHPYATLAIPVLAEAVSIFHNQSELYYVPKQAALGNYNDTFGNALYMLSIEPAESREDEPLFEYPDDIETTDDILTKLRRGEGVFIDEENYITSRLFDMVVGDWDREPDHWRWAEYAVSDSLNSYVPIPRNRDDAFASFEGNVLDFARTLFGRTYQRHVYNDNFNDFRWFNEEGIILDRALLKRSGRQQWKIIAQRLQEKLSDEVIDSAFTRVPIEVRDESLESIIENLKGRRDKVIEFANRYYEYLARLQTIVGNNHANYFEITRLPNGKTNIKEYGYENNVKSLLLTDRTYSSSETNEIWLYGLDGNDFFKVTGSGDNPIFLRIIGGQGYDTYRLENGNGVKVYDHESRPSYVELNNGGNLRLTDVYTLNTYDYRKQITKVHAQAAALGYNPDDGMRVAAQYIYQINSFQRNPFSRQHKLNAGYYFDTESFDIEYEGEIANVRNTLNLNYGARVTSPNYTVNYFGYGNETSNREGARGYDFNRVQLQTISANAGLLRNSNFGSFFKLQGKFEAVILQSEINDGLNPGAILTKDDTAYFGTLEGIYNYRSFDNPRNPTIGMMIDLYAGATTNIEDTDRLYSFLQTRLGFYNSLTKNSKWVLKTNLRAQFNFDNPYEFFQAVTLGANNGLRGYREERFSGKSALVGSADVRYSFNEFNIELVPIQIGVYGGADLGRVWTPSGNSEKWHNDYGGGFWINGSGGLSASASAFHSTEGTRIIFGLGFDF